MKATTYTITPEYEDDHLARYVVESNIPDMRVVAIFRYDGLELAKKLVADLEAGIVDPWDC